MQEEGRKTTLTNGPVRLSRVFRQPDAQTETDSVPLRSIVLWAVVAAAIVAGVVLYFRFARHLTPLIGG